MQKRASCHQRKCKILYFLNTMIMKHLFTFILFCLLSIPSNAQWSNLTNLFYDSLDMRVAQAANEQKNPLVIKSESDGGYFIVWEDYRNDVNRADIYAQKYDKNGNRQWTDNGVPVATGVSAQRYSDIYLNGSGGSNYGYREVSHGCGDKAGGLYIAWHDYVSIGSYEYRRVSVQHITNSGKAVFGNGGFVIASPDATTNNEYSIPQLIADQQGGFFIGYGQSKLQSSFYNVFVYGYKEAGGTLVRYGGDTMNNNYSAKSFKLITDGQGGCGVAMKIEMNAQQDMIAFTQLCRIKKDSKTVNKIERGFDVQWETSWLEDWFGDQSTLLPWHAVYDTIHTNDPYGYVEKSVGGSDAADYYVDAYLDSLKKHGLSYPGYLIAEKYQWKYDTTIYSKGSIIPLNYGNLLNSTVYGIERVNAGLLPTAGNINVALITWNERDYVNSNLTGWTTRYLPVATEIFDSIPWQLTRSLTNPNPKKPSNLDTVVRGGNTTDTIINGNATTSYEYAFAASGNKVMLATTPLNPNNTNNPLYYQELELARKNEHTFSVNINTTSQNGIALGQGGSSYPAYSFPIPAVAGDGAGNAMIYFDQYHSWIQASPLGKGGKLWWGNLGAPLSPDVWKGTYTYPDAPYVYMDEGGKAVIAWNDQRQLPDGTYSGNNIYMRHLDNLLLTSYQPPLRAQLLGESNAVAARGMQQTLTGSSNAYTVFQAGVYGSTGVSDYTPLALIKDDYDLGAVTVYAQDNIGTIRTTAKGKPYLDRDYTITVTKHPAGAAIHVRLVFTKAQFDALKVHDASIQDPGDVAVIKQPHTNGNINAPTIYTPVAGEQGIKPVAWAAIENDNKITGYYIEIVVSDFSNFFIASKQAVLPVVLEYFTVKAANKSALLQWKTASEINVGHFDVQRSADGISFTTIGTVQANSNTANGQLYTYTDVSPLKGNNLYRLAEVDLDGKTVYSETRFLVFNTETGVFNAFPNPSKGLVHIELPQAATGERALQLFNIGGQKVLQTTIPAGAKQADIDISTLGAGTYILKYGNKSIKVIKQ